MPKVGLVAHGSRTRVLCSSVLLTLASKSVPWCGGL